MPDSTPVREGDSFTIAAIDLRMLLKRLKPALPKRREADRATVSFYLEPDHLDIVLAGARVGTLAQTDRPFVAHVPFNEFAWIAKETFRDGESLIFGFAPGRLTFRAVTINNPLIRVGDGGRDDGVPSGLEAPSAATPEPMGSVALPLAAAFHELRKHPPGTFHGNPRLQSAETEIDAILRKAEKLLKPLGISKSDLESLMNARVER